MIDSAKQLNSVLSIMELSVVTALSKIFEWASDNSATFITIILGALWASLILPRIQRRFARASRIEDRKVTISEDIAKSFNLYVTNWRRLRDYSSFLETFPVEGSEKTSKQEALYKYAAERNRSRDELMQTLALCRLYFDTATCCAVTEFIEWDEMHAVTPLHELPPLSEWRKHQNRILKMVQNEK